MSLDGLIRANRLANSRKSPDSCDRLRVPKLNLVFVHRASGGGGVKIANRRFEAIRANRSHVMKVVFFLRIAGPSKVLRICNTFVLRCDAVHPKNLHA